MNIIYSKYIDCGFEKIAIIAEENSNYCLEELSIK